MNNNEILLLKLGEVVLKGLNRRSFEDKLVSNVRRRMKPCGSFQIYIRQSTIYVEPQTEDCDMEAAFKAARQVFGIVTVARAVPCAKEMDAIVETAKTYLADEFAKARTFKVESRRADKQFPMNSIQISQYVGGELGQFFNVKADMHHPDLTVYVEIREKYAYIHTPSVPGAGGLPIGMGGRAVSLLSGGLDSPVSSYMIARRGVELEMVHFVSPPYTSQQALDKVLELARLLTVYCGRMIVHIIPFTEIQEEIRRQCPEEYFTLIMRRFMMRLAEAVARKSHASALVTGESLGQVASQTIKALGIPAVQINTAGACHLESDMLRRALDVLDLDDIDLIFIENVGNLVCPADFYLGENIKMMILSVPEGDDKPLKYPGMFQVADAIILNKIDVMPAFTFDKTLFDEHIERLNPGAPSFAIAATKGDGVDEWASWLSEQIEAAK